MATEASFANMPLRLGSAEDFARVESLLRSSHFDEATVCGLLKIHSLSHLGAVDREQVELSDAGLGALAPLIRLFLLLEAVDRDAVKQAVSPGAIESLLALDLIRPVSTPDGEACCSTVLLCPVAGRFVASDRHKSPDGSPFTPPPDAVFPAAFIGTLRFLRVISTAPTKDALDLCSGSGIAALVLSKSSQRVVACDITARATHFAEFNRALNRCFNVEVEEGDLYSAVEGRTFDRIVAHPPYVPSLGTEQIYRDGGETGETLVKRIIEGLPQHLNPGGSFYCVCAGWDAHDGPFEERARAWLGESHRDFDVIFAINNDMAPEQLAEQLAKQSPRDGADTLQWDRLFSDAGMERLVYGAVVIHRRSKAEVAGEGEPLTLRLRLSTLTDGACLDWALRWHRWRARAEKTGQLSGAVLGSRPRFGPRLQAKVTYAVEEGTLVATDVVLESESPFLAATRVDLWVMPVVANFNGTRAVAEVYETAREASMTPVSLSLDDFAGLVANMIERGYLEIDESELRPR
ncbi:MAG TPA: methyltransferase [Blastocatellia bacterium]|nr:methyltransferase [Blastocatellia bacterium]